MSLIRADRRFVAFFLASLRTPSAQPTRCDGWTAHDVVAHVAAGSEELADLMELACSGQTRSTRGFVERQAPYRAMSRLRLHRMLVRHGLRATWQLWRLRRVGQTIEFTGTTMTAAQVARHAESELVLHRFDLVGLDRPARRHLGDPNLVAHARETVGRMDRGVLPEPSRSPIELLAIWGDEDWGRSYAASFL